MTFSTYLQCNAILPEEVKLSKNFEFPVQSTTETDETVIEYNSFNINKSLITYSIKLN